MRERQKLNRQPPTFCIICRINKADIAVIQISRKINNKKYFQPFQRRAQAERLTAQFELRGERSNQINRREADLKLGEFLQKYSNFRMTVASIKQTVMERVNRDVLQPLLPQTNVLNIIIGIRVARRNGDRRLQQFIEKKSGSASTQLGQRSQKAKIANQSQIAEDSNGESKRKLSRKLTTMFDQIDLNVHFHPSLISQFTNGPSKSEIEMEIDCKFREELQNNFSIIQPHKLAISLSENHLFEKKQNQYNLPTRPKKTLTRKDDKQRGQCDSKKKVSSRDQMKNAKQSIHYRAQTDYDCQVIERKASKSNRQPKQKIRPLVITSTSKKKNSLKSGSLNKFQSVKRLQKHS